MCFLDDAILYNYSKRVNMVNVEWNFEHKSGIFFLVVDKWKTGEMNAKAYFETASANNRS